MAVALVGGALANKPQNGGNAWTRLAWLLGLRRLGFAVYFAEQIAPEAWRRPNWERAIADARRKEGGQ